SAAAPASTIFVFATVVTSSLIDLHLGAQVHVQVSGVQVIVIDLDQIVIEHTLAPGDWQIPGPVAGQGRHTHTLRMYALDSLQPAFDLALIAGFHPNEVAVFEALLLGRGGVYGYVVRVIVHLGGFVEPGVLHRQGVGVDRVSIVEADEIVLRVRALVRRTRVPVRHGLVSLVVQIVLDAEFFGNLAHLLASRLKYFEVNRNPDRHAAAPVDL